ncbi:MAG: type III-B CRISPR module-associated protein Cmr3 [Candidatus Competibacteraceae bacterium]|nr:type III-B CRISPR module-associated protein Cmr3 [Candidatus Competibacteraceae bacterium]
MTEYRFLEPLDVLFLRGNKLFDGAGAYGAALMPPWPSLAAGALRSRMLADHGADLAAFARSNSLTDSRLAESLGTPNQPGHFRIAGFTLARRVGDAIEPCFPLPADVVVTNQDLSDASYLEPITVSGALRFSAVFPALPILRTEKSAKPINGLWLNGIGWKAYLNGERLTCAHLLPSSDLWQTDPRLGIALNGSRGTVQTGMLYTADAVALRRKGWDAALGREYHDAGLFVSVDGADGLIPQDGLLRLGGDGRGATIVPCSASLAKPDWSRIEGEKRFRLILATPGLFEHGWRLPGLDVEGIWHGPAGCIARLSAASVNRAEVVSGWDLTGHKGGSPKKAFRVAPTGSVYWFEDFQGKAEDLGKLAAEGFWAISDYPDRGRRAEGFNNVFIAAWPQQ